MLAGLRTHSQLKRIGVYQQPCYTNLCTVFSKCTVEMMSTIMVMNSRNTNFSAATLHPIDANLDTLTAHAQATSTSHAPVASMHEEDSFNTVAKVRRVEERSQAVTSRGVPPEVSNRFREVVFVLVCSSGLLLFSILQGNVSVNQQTFQTALGIQTSRLPWLNGSYLIALGMSVIIAGSVADLAPPRLIMVAASASLCLCNLVCCFALMPDKAVLYFVVRAFQGLAVGVVMSVGKSILGSVYKPGIRKTKV